LAEKDKIQDKDFEELIEQTASKYAERMRKDRHSNSDWKYTISIDRKGEGILSWERRKEMKIYP